MRWKSATNPSLARTIVPSLSLNLSWSTNTTTGLRVTKIRHVRYHGEVGGSRGRLDSRGDKTGVFIRNVLSPIAGKAAAENLVEEGQHRVWRS